MSFSSLTLSLHPYLCLNFPPLCSSDTLYLCPSLSSPPGLPTIPNLLPQALQIPLLQVHLQQRTGVAMVRIWYQSQQRVHCVLATQMHINEYNWLPGTLLCPPLLRHRAWGRTSQDTSCIFRRWPRLATWSQVWGVDRGLGRRGLMSWISRFQKRKGNGPHEIHDSCEGLPLGRIYYH